MGYIASLNLTDSEVRALIRVKDKKGINSVDDLISNQIRKMIIEEDPGEGKNQLEIHL